MTNPSADPGTKTEARRHHADLRQKEEALAKVPPSDLPPGRFRPDDELLAFLEGL